MYNCREIGGGVAVLRTDYRITCHTTEHQLFRIVAGALIAPTLLHIATSDSASAFDPDAGTGEALSVATLANLALRLVWPSEENAFFDLQTCPPWLYLLAIFAARTVGAARQRGAEALAGR